MYFVHTCRNLAPDRLDKIMCSACREKTVGKRKRVYNRQLIFHFPMRDYKIRTVQKQRTHIVREMKRYTRSIEIELQVRNTLKRTMINLEYKYL